MRFIDRIESLVSPERERLLASPTLRRIGAGAIDRTEYIELLTMLYHHVRHTSRKLSTAAWRCGTHQQALRDLLSHHAREERGHDQWILSDLAALGVSGASIQASAPSPACQALIGYGYYLASMEHPAAILAEGYFVESLSQGHASETAQRLQAALGIGPDATRFLADHGDLDQEHAGEYDGVFDEVLDGAGRAAVLRCAPTAAWTYVNAYEAIEFAPAIPTALAA